MSLGAGKNINIAGMAMSHAAYSSEVTTSDMARSINIFQRLFPGAGNNLELNSWCFRSSDGVYGLVSRGLGTNWIQTESLVREIALGCVDRLGAVAHELRRPVSSPVLEVA